MKPVAKVVVSHDCRAMLRTIGELPPEGSFLYAIPADQVLVPRELLARVEESLRCEIEERYAGTKDHPAIRPKYLRDIAEADELRTLLHP